jgi:DNA-binding NarL/FixJ family response regulator
MRWSRLQIWISGLVLKDFIIHLTYAEKSVSADSAHSIRPDVSEVPALNSPADHPMVIEGVKALLLNAEDMSVVGTVNDAFLAMAFLKINPVDVVLLDINLPDLKCTWARKFRKFWCRVRCPTPVHSAADLPRKEVLACIAEGMTNNEIADKLFISPLTVDSHRKNLLAKFQAKNTAALVKIAMENQLI